MITGALFVVLLAAREAVRLTRRDAPALRVLDRMLVPVTFGFAVVVLLRVAELVARGA